MKNSEMFHAVLSASIASRLTDEDLEQFAIMSDRNAYICQTDVIQSDYYQKISAVLRDYVRMRKLMNTVKAKVNYAFYHGDTYTTQYAITDIHRLLAEAEKGAMK